MGATAVYHRLTESGMAKAGRVNQTLMEEDTSVSKEVSMEIRKQSIHEQIHNGKEFLIRRYRAYNHILYLQSYSNTFGNIKELQEIYEYALSQDEFVEFVIATRPDCINEEIADMLASYKKGSINDIWVELGLQSGNDQTLETINRGHAVASCKKAAALLRDRGIKVSLHVILGLPLEGYKEMERTAEVVRDIAPEAVKIHNLHVPIRTQMFYQYQLGEFSPPAQIRHLSNTIWFLERIPSQIIIQRVVCDTPSHRLAAPVRFGSKGSFVHLLQTEMKKRGSYQGRVLLEDEHHDEES